MKLSPYKNIAAEASREKRRLNAREFQRQKRERAKHLGLNSFILWLSPADVEILKSIKHRFGLVRDERCGRSRRSPSVWRRLSKKIVLEQQRPTGKVLDDYCGRRS